MEWPSVTQILGWAIPRDFALHDYYLRRGSWVHGACDIIANGQELDIDHSSYALGCKGHDMPLSRNGSTEQWMAYLEAYRQWWSERPAMFEHLISSEYEVRNDIEQYVGHPDQLWRLADGREAIIDLKTGTAPKTTALQVAAYDLAEPHEKRRRRFALQLRPAEKSKLIEYTSERDYNAFRLLVRAYWIVNGKEYAG